MTMPKNTPLPPYAHWALLTLFLTVLAVCVLLQLLGVVEDAGAAFEAFRVWFAHLLGVDPHNPGA